jgi:hypothetical protein
MSPITIHVSVAIFTHVAVEFATRNLGAVLVQPVLKIVVVPDVVA